MTARGAVLDASDGPADPASDDEGAAMRSRSERSRVEQRRRRSTRRRGWACLLIATVLVATTVVVGNAVRHRQESGAGGSTPAAPAVRTTLFAIGRDDGTAAVTVLLGEGRSGGPSTAVMIPGSLQVETPGLDRQSVGDLTALGGVATLGLAVRNTLGVRLDNTAVIPAAEAAASLAAVGPLDIDLRNPVDLSAVPGGRRFPDGPQEVTGAEAWLLLTALPPGGERDHLDAARAVLTAWAVAEAKTDGRVDEVAAIARSEAAFQTLPVEVAVTDDGSDRYTLDREGTTRAVRRWFPGALDHLGSGRPKVEVRNGSGAVGVTQQAASAIVPLGAQVTLTGNVAQFGVPTSTVSYYRREDAAAAHAIADALGITSVSRIESNVNVVDISVVLGADFTAPSPPNAETAPST